jgi:hypothetical protein
VAGVGAAGLLISWTFSIFAGVTVRRHSILPALIDAQGGELLRHRIKFGKENASFGNNGR